MSKGNLGIVKAGKGEELRTKNASLTTSTLRTVGLRKQNAAKAGRMITTHTARTK
jgi:hypothetical protein